MQTFPTLLSLALTSTIAFAADREAVLASAARRYDLSRAPEGVKIEGKVTFDAEVKTARFEGGWLNAGAEWHPSGNALTVHLRARVADGNRTQSLFAKRGQPIAVNLFAVDLPATPGPDIGLEITTDRGFTMISFPVVLIATKAWHDLAGRYDGKRLQLLCDGKVMAEAPASGPLIQNREPLLIGAETGADGKVVTQRIFRGEIAEAAIWDRALPDEELAAVMRQPGLIAASSSVAAAPSTQLEAFRAFRAAMRDDPHRPRWHFLCPEEGHAMPFDPNGAIWWRGRYHLFYIF